MILKIATKQIMLHVDEIASSTNTKSGLFLPVSCSALRECGVINEEYSKGMQYHCL